MEIQVNTRNSGQATVALFGAINEDADAKLHLLAAELRPFGSIEFIFDKVTGINSLGVRAWVTFLRSIRNNNRKIIFSRCPPDIISQINMIPSFAEGADIDSFYVNYICPSCDGTLLHLVMRQSLAPKTLPQSGRCPHCAQAVMETEELEDEYFAFLLRPTAS